MLRIHFTLTFVPLSLPLCASACQRRFNFPCEYKMRLLRAVLVECCDVALWCRAASWEASAGRDVDIKARLPEHLELCIYFEARPVIHPQTEGPPQQHISKHSGSIPASNFSISLYLRSQVLQKGNNTKHVPVMVAVRWSRAEYQEDKEQFKVVHLLETRSISEA